MNKYKIPFPFVDVYFFQWNVLKRSGIHNHAENGCYLLLLKGKIKENIYNQNFTKIKTNIYKPFSLLMKALVPSFFRVYPHEKPFFLSSNSGAEFLSMGSKIFLKNLS